MTPRIAAALGCAVGVIAGAAVGYGIAIVVLLRQWRWEDVPPASIHIAGPTIAEHDAELLRRSYEALRERKGGAR